MQIKFFMSPEDELGTMEFIEKKGGYFIHDYWKPSTPEIRIIGREELADSVKFREIGILFREILPVTSDHVFLGDLRTTDGFPRVEVIDFTRSYANGKVLYPGRLWINGLKPETERSYKSIAGFIRRNSTSVGGWYHGKGVERYCAENHLAKAVSTHA
jgi:hypothetical protein